jgi:GNAT superfamily N-acetyltransferase
VYQTITNNYMLSPKRHDVNHAHYGAFFDTIGLIEDKYWSTDGEYPENIELSTLYVRPESQRQGVGSELVEWGLRVAKEKGIAVGVQAQEKPIPFYERLGFKRLNTVTIRSAGEDGSVALPVLVHDPTKLQASQKGTATQL